MLKRLCRLSIILLMFIVISNPVLASENEFDDFGFRKGIDRHKVEAANYIQDNYTLEDDTWIELPLVSNVDINKPSWTITFSRAVQLKDINRINILKNNEYIAIKEPRYETGKNNIVIFPKTKYVPNQRYSILVILNNGKKYKKDFITQTLDGAFPNNSILNATKIELKKPQEKVFAIEEYIESGTEEYYFIDVKDSGKLDIEVNRYDYENINLYLSIVDYNYIEKEIIREGSKMVDWGGETDSKRRIIVDVEPGRYYIKMSSNYRKDHLNLNAKAGNYRLDVNFIKTNIKNDLEFNDTNIYSMPIGFNDSETGRIMYVRKDGTRDLVDYFKFTVSTSGRVNINVDMLNLYGDPRGKDFYNINLSILKLDKANKEEVMQSDKSTIIDNNISSRKSISIDLEPGQYYIKIDTLLIYDYIEFDGYSGDYVLTVKYEN